MLHYDSYNMAGIMSADELAFSLLIHAGYQHDLHGHTAARCW
jgi:hypothetical protein